MWAAGVGLLVLSSLLLLASGLLYYRAHRKHEEAENALARALAAKDGALHDLQRAEHVMAEAEIYLSAARAVARDAAEEVMQRGAS